MSAMMDPQREAVVSPWYYSKLTVEQMEKL